MNKIISVANVFGLVLVVLTGAYAQSVQEERKVLRGLDGLRVEVKRLKPEIERDGLFVDLLQTDVELKLRMAGIKVISEGEESSIPGGPYLFLNVDAMKSSIGYVYRIQLSLREPVTLTRNALKVVGTTFRTQDQFGISPHLSDIREEVRDITDEFTAAWLQANSK
jgi:hypothetical protein